MSLTSDLFSSSSTSFSAFSSLIISACFCLNFSLSSLSSLAFSFSLFSLLFSLIGNKGNEIVSKTNKSLKGNLNLSPPNIYILFPSTQAVCPSLGSGISPLIRSIFSFNFSFSSLDNIFNPSLILSGLEVNIKVFLIFITFGRHKTWSLYFPSPSLLLFLSDFFSGFFVFFLFLSTFVIFNVFIPCWLFLFFCISFFFFLRSFSLSNSASLLNELKLGFVLFSTSLLVNHLNFFSSFLFSADISLNSSLVNCSNKVSWTHSYCVVDGINFHISLLSLINPVLPPKM